MRLQQCTKDILLFPRKKLTYNRILFGKIAPSYDFITRILSFGNDQNWKNILVAKLPFKHKCRILDVACGTGDLTIRLSKKFSSCLIIGVDLTPEMINVAIKKNGSAATFQIQDFSRLAFLSESFDIITGGYALRNAPDLKRSLLEFHRVLKNGGIAAFLDFSKSSCFLIQKIQYALLIIWGFIWGLLIHRNPRFYTYIAKSLKVFPDSYKLHILIKNCGFSVLETKDLFWGMAEIILCKKGLICQ